MRQRLHRHMPTGCRISRSRRETLVDFPMTQWDLRLQMARQCWDEARHTKLAQHASGPRRTQGEFPVMNYEWGVVCLMESLEDASRSRTAPSKPARWISSAS